MAPSSDWLNKPERLEGMASADAARLNATGCDGPERRRAVDPGMRLQPLSPAATEGLPRAAHEGGGD